MKENEGIKKTINSINPKELKIDFKKVVNQEIQNEQIAILKQNLINNFNRVRYGITSTNSK